MLPGDEHVQTAAKREERSGRMRVAVALADSDGEAFLVLDAIPDGADLVEAGALRSRRVEAEA